MDQSRHNPQLPGIRLEVVSKVRPQKSCESYDSAASGMSWSSSQSFTTSARDSQQSQQQQSSKQPTSLRNSNSLSSNPSITGYDVSDEDPCQSQYNSSPGQLSRSHVSPRVDRRPARRDRKTFTSGASFEEEEAEYVEEDHKNVMAKRDVDKEIQSTPATSTEVFHVSVHKEEEKTQHDSQPTATHATITKRKSFKHFWKAAYRTIRNEAAKESAIKMEEDCEAEIDPIYLLLKSAATQRQAALKSTSSSIDHGEPTTRNQRLSSSSRTSSVSQKD